MFMVVSRRLRTPAARSLRHVPLRLDADHVPGTVRPSPHHRPRYATFEYEHYELVSRGIVTRPERFSAVTVTRDRRRSVSR